MVGVSYPRKNGKSTLTWCLFLAKQGYTDEQIEAIIEEAERRLKTMKYRKKPVIIEAYQTEKEMDIETLEGTMHASVGDYIITGVNGEQYPCKPDIFEKTYERV